jgi:RNA polymerase sigma-70 factor (ECF subfamily)
MSTAEAPVPVPATLSDTEIVRRVRAGEPALFELIVRRYNQRLYRTARAIVKNEAEAEDVMQQAYISAFQHLATFAGNAQFSTWLIRITINVALMRLRKDRKLSLVDDEGAWETLMTHDTPPPSPEQQASTHELATLLEAAVDALPEAYRMVFALREIEELSTAEVASALEVSEDVVKQRLHRAKGLVQDHLAKRALAEAKTAFEFLAPRCNRLTAAVMAEVLKIEG